MKNHVDKYTYRVEWSEEDKTHIARCLEFPSLTADSSTPEKAITELRKVVETSVDWMKEEGEEIPEPIGLQKFKGNLTLRVPPEVHKNLAIKSAEEGVSINQYILSKLA